MIDAAPPPSLPLSSQSEMFARVMARPARTTTLVVVALTFILLIGLPRPLSSDISGQLWIADQLLHGSRLYLDISEINPPLWFWLAMPVVALADATGLRATDVLVLAMGAAALASLLATNRLIRDVSPATRTAFLSYAACVLIVMPLRDLGQREQMALIGALPYVALITARRTGHPVPWALALVVAVAAATGFALKHYFVGVPLLLECWLLIGLRRRWRPFRVETLALAAGAAGYAAAILIFTPGYLQVSVPELLIAYGATSAADFSYLVRPAQPIWVLIICAVLMQRRGLDHPKSAMSTGLLLAAAGFFAAWAIQHKGWPYQSIATTGTLALALAMTLVESATTRPRIITVAALCAPILLFLAPTQWVPTAETDIAPALADLGPGDAVAIIAKEGRTAWPTTVDRGFRFSGRRGSYWIFAAIDANRTTRHDPRIDALGRKAIEEVVGDFRCLPPKRIVFAPGHAPLSMTSASANPLGYFTQNRQFADLLRHYHRLDRPGNFDAFDLVTPLEPVATTICSGRG